MGSMYARILERLETSRYRGSNSTSRVVVVIYKVLLKLVHWLGTDNSV